MILTPGLRRFLLTIHVACSVGWFGGVMSFLCLAIIGFSSVDAELVRAVYLAMERIASIILVPLSFASPLTGIIQSQTTTWGLFRHYWVLVKLLMTIPSTLILLLHMQPIRLLAGAARETILSDAGLGRLQLQLVVSATAAALVLLITTAFALYKPRGMTRYGLRKQRAVSRS